MVNIKYLYKDTFAVIGKAGEGPADRGPEWIGPLWEKVSADYSKIEGICRKDDNGGLIWWGAMNDSEESNKPWKDTGKYMPGCEADINPFPLGETLPAEGWTKWIIPAQTYLVASVSPDSYGQVFREIISDKSISIVGSVHEHYPVQGDPSIMELWFPVRKGMTFCRSCSIPMTKQEDFGTEEDGNSNIDYCCHCYEDGELHKDVTMDKLTADVQKLLEIETEHPGLLSRLLLNDINEWITLESDSEKEAAAPALCSKLVDGQDCDLTGTPWEKEWVADGKVCHCIACVAARKCIADIKLMESH